MLADGQQAAGRRRLVGALYLNQFRLAERSHNIHESRGGQAEHHPAWGRRRLHSLRHSDMLADGRVTQSARTDFTGYHLTGVQADTNGEFNAVATVHPRGNDLSRLLDPQRSKTRPHRMVLQRHRRAENRHDPVAGEFVHRAAVALHHRTREIHKLGHDLA